MQTNKLPNLLGKIFRIVKKIDVQFLHAGIMRYRLINPLEKELMSAEILKQYLLELSIFSLEDNYVSMKYRPSSKHLSNEDTLLLSIFFKLGRIFDTKQYMIEMVKLGFSQNQANVTSQVSPLLISLVKGRFKKRGERSFIFTLDDLYFDNLEDLLEEDTIDVETKFISFNIDSKIKLQGLLDINGLKVTDGEYELLDDYENVLSKVKVFKKVLYGLQKFSMKEKEGVFKINFNKKLNCFFVSRLKH